MDKLLAREEKVFEDLDSFLNGNMVYFLETMYEVVERKTRKPSLFPQKQLKFMVTKDQRGGYKILTSKSSTPLGLKCKFSGGDRCETDITFWMKQRTVRPDILDEFSYITWAICQFSVRLISLKHIHHDGSTKLVLTAEITRDA